MEDPRFNGRARHSVEMLRTNEPEGENISPEVQVLLKMFSFSKETGWAEKCAVGQKINLVGDTLLYGVDAFPLLRPLRQTVFTCFLVRHESS